MVITLVLLKRYDLLKIQDVDVLTILNNELKNMFMFQSLTIFKFQARTLQKHILKCHIHSMSSNAIFSICLSYKNHHRIYRIKPTYTPDGRLASYRFPTMIKKKGLLLRLRDFVLNKVSFYKNLN